MNTTFAGIIPPLLTPLTPDERTAWSVTPSSCPCTGEQPNSNHDA